MASFVHPKAIVSPYARLGIDVSIGAFSVIGDHVVLGDHTQIGVGVVIEGNTKIGEYNRIHAHSVIGGTPQDKKYRDQETELVIGDRNTIREFCTLNLGTVEGGGVTQVGSDNWIMAYCHVAHDCRVGHDCVLANGVQLAGHVELGDYVVLGGMTGVHQFCKIGSHVMAGVSSVITQDIVPFVTVGGMPLAVHGLNSKGLVRRGFDESDLNFLKQVYRLLFRRNLTLAEASQEINSLTELTDQHKMIKQLMLKFLERTERGITR